MNKRVKRIIGIFIGLLLWGKRKIIRRIVLP